MAGGLMLEMALIKLIERGRIEDVRGFATGFELSIGDEECTKVAEYLDGLMDEEKEEEGN